MLLLNSTDCKTMKPSTVTNLSVSREIGFLYIGVTSEIFGGLSLVDSNGAGDEGHQWERVLLLGCL